MVSISITYLGDLRCEAVHGPSGARLQTDAPKDNEGKGEGFSPTDLAATALGTCMMTIMGIVARRDGIDLTGVKIDVTKEMTSVPSRRIGRLEIAFRMPRSLPEEQRTKLARAAATCPVHKSLSPDTKVDVQFHYPS